MKRTERREKRGPEWVENQNKRQRFTLAWLALVKLRSMRRGTHDVLHTHCTLKPHPSHILPSPVSSCPWPVLQPGKHHCMMCQSTIPMLVARHGWASRCFTHMNVQSKLVKIKKGRAKKHVWQRENNRGESYLSPVTSLPLGASSTSAAPLLAGFWGQT